MARTNVENRKRKRSGAPDPRSNLPDEEITEPSSNDEGSDGEASLGGNENEEIDSEEEFQHENAADKRRRLAKQYLENLKADANEVVLQGEARVQEDEAQISDYNNFDARDLDREIVASRLKQDVAEQHGRIYRFIGDKLLISEAKISFSRVGEKNLTAISCYQPVINKFSHEESQNKSKGRMFAYTVSKDMSLTKYDVTDFNARPKKLKFAKGGRRFIPESNFEFENTTEGHYDEILTLAASPDGRYVVTGGRDRKLIVWSTESLAPVKVIPTKDRRGEVLSVVFRKNSDQLYAACADYKIRTYSINQFSQLEILYGHQDLVVGISALGMERCVTVGSRDRTAMLWKIADETRLTFRGGDDPERLAKKWIKQHTEKTEDGREIPPNDSEVPEFYGEGSIDCVTMIDDSHFITGSDNGNISLWSLSKKKPVFTERVAHGIVPPPSPLQISAEKDEAKREAQLQNKQIAQPHWVTALYAIPYSNVFISGSWDGKLRVWKITENVRGFELLGELPGCHGVVTHIQAVESGKHGRETFRVLASVSKEHRLGRWMTKIPGARNGIFSATIEQTGF
ncbi:ribosomal RNA-processing protein RRP9 [Lachancea thermotolerans CBS 6340]|uniref:KLTH0F14344p n=1 Tax=Lachancea thermotolerans (strain ATCC 56472 / CBS 6340 / NRRL Y-8284) TaxID=559295 RepID=C5DJ86_LACTC|nr:KLTH0F14344p [Lachancea thermotolerans CBS 6340]CAR24375.1 KLTH0F14344p [Lachancea thermotolerans CBS 6340]